MEDVEVVPGTVIPAAELQFSFARSGGPGGQHVNTSATKVELRFDVAGSASLDDEQKDRIRRALGNRLTAGDVLVLQASEYRSQHRNREAVVTRLGNLLAEALAPETPRKPTSPSRRARAQRLDSKRHQAEKKALRRPPESP